MQTAQSHAGVRSGHGGASIEPNLREVVEGVKPYPRAVTGKEWAHRINASLPHNCNNLPIRELSSPGPLPQSTSQFPYSSQNSVCPAGLPVRQGRFCPFWPRQHVSMAGLHLASQADCGYSRTC